MFRVVFYVALGNTHPQTNRIFLIILLRMYRIHFCISPTFEGVKVNILRRKLGQAGFKSNLSLVCQVICQNTSGMVYVLYYSWSNTPSFIITRLPPMHNSNPLASWKLSSMHHYDNTVFLLASSFVMHYSHTPLRRSFKRGGCKMKAFTFRGLLLTGFATHTLTWIHLDLSVFLNVFLEMSKDFVDVVACRSKVHFQVFWKI